MLLSFIVHTHSLRYWLPATIMLGTAPAYVLSWGVWRLLSSVLPARLYHKLDDRLYCIYQSMVLFFFENYTGVEVSRRPRDFVPVVHKSLVDRLHSFCLFVVSPHLVTVCMLGVCIQVGVVKPDGIFDWQKSLQVFLIKPPRICSSK